MGERVQVQAKASTDVGLQTSSEPDRRVEHATDHSPTTEPELSGRGGWATSPHAIHRRRSLITYWCVRSGERMHTQVSLHRRYHARYLVGVR